MVRQGVGVAVAVVVLAGCGGGGGRSDEEKVVETVKQFRSGAKSHDEGKLCRELLHPNTLRVVKRLAQADAPPGGKAATCEETYRKRGPREKALEGRGPKPSEVTIRGDVAFLPDPDGGTRPLVRRAGDTWKLDFTADPELGWRARASFACVHWQQGLQRLPLPTASRRGIIALMDAQAELAASFMRELDANSARGDATAPARDLEDALESLQGRFKQVASGLRRGGSLETLTNRAAKASSNEFRNLLLAVSEAKLSCGRIPASAPDGAGFRRKAAAVCEPIHASFQRLPDPSSSRSAAIRFLRRGSALERRASSGLADLKPPADLDGVYRETLSTLNGLGATLRAESAAVRRGDVRAAEHAVGRLQTLDFRKSAGFSRLGVPACAAL
jgi:hypothetical protein